MTDRELLELAAKAADINIEYWHTTGTPMFRNAKGLAEFWNPLTDDGDALRLAVQLSIRFACMFGFAHAWTGLRECREAEVSDPYAASRRAIVRAAAEIGKTRSD